MISPEDLRELERRERERDMEAARHEMVDSASDERVVNNTMRHQYRVLNDQEKQAMNAIKDHGVVFHDLLDRTVPHGRELALAKTKLEEAVMWAVKGLTA